MKKFLGLLIFMFLLVPTGVCNSADLKDVSGDDWFKAHVDALVSLNVIDGFPDGTFRPGGNVNVDAFIKMTVTALGHTDIENSSTYWAGTYIDRAKKLQLVFEGEFQDYRRPVARQEMARIIVRALQEDYPGNLQDYSQHIRDYSGIPPEFREPILKAYSKGILTGYPDGTFRGSSTATRAESAAIIHRLIDEEVRKVPEPEQGVLEQLLLTGDYVLAYDDCDWIYTHKTMGKADLSDYNIIETQNFTIARNPGTNETTDMTVLLYKPTKEVRRILEGIFKIAFPINHETVNKYFILTLRGELWERAMEPGLEFGTLIGDREIAIKNSKTLWNNGAITIKIGIKGYQSPEEYYTRHPSVWGEKPLTHIKKMIDDFNITEYTISDFFREHPDYIGPYYGETKDNYIGKDDFTRLQQWRQYGAEFLRKQLWID